MGRGGSRLFKILSTVRGEGREGWGWFCVEQVKGELEVYGVYGVSEK